MKEFTLVPFYFADNLSGLIPARRQVKKLAHPHLYVELSRMTGIPLPRP
jgi:hypothetical protein